MTGDGEVTRRESRNTGERDIESIKQELATAVGLAALTDASLHEVAERAGVSRDLHERGTPTFQGRE